MRLELGLLEKIINIIDWLFRDRE